MADAETSRCDGGGGGMGTVGRGRVPGAEHACRRSAEPADGRSGAVFGCAAAGAMRQQAGRCCQAQHGGEVSLSGRGTGASPGATAAPNLSGVPDAPDTSGASSAPLGKQDASKAFPFPGEAKPGSDANQPGTSSSSSSSSGDDATPTDAGATPAGGAPGLDDKGSEGSAATPGRHLLHRVNPVGTKLQSADEREAEDLDVAHTYIGMGDLQGAYMRTQDAVKTSPDDPDAHFALAEVAAKLEKRDEAINEYNACLKLDPPEKEAKDARKALERLKP